MENVIWEKYHCSKAVTLMTVLKKYIIYIATWTNPSLCILTKILNCSFPRVICEVKYSADFSSVTASLFLPPCLVAFVNDWKTIRYWKFKRDRTDNKSVETHKIINSIHKAALVKVHKDNNKKPALMLQFTNKNVYLLSYFVEYQYCPCNVTWLVTE